MAARFVTVNPAGGEDYTSLSAAEAGEQTIGANLVTAGDTLEIQFAGTWSSEDTTAATISGFTTGASNWIRITVDSANRHAGAWDASKARMLVAGICIQVSDDYVEMIGLQLESTTSAAARSANVGSLVDACICRGGGVSTSNAAARVNVRNALLVDGSTTLARGINVVTSGSEIRAHNVTYVGTNSSNTNAAFFASAGTVLTTNNCLFKDTSAGTPTGWGGTGTISGDYNASSDATAPGANSIQSATFAFVNEAGGDYQLDASDTSGALTGGQDLSADANLPVTVDVNGVARPSTPTIGYSQIASASDYGISTETDSAVALVGTDNATYGVATETGAAVALVGSESVAYGVATETDEAVALVDDSGTFYGIATEADLAVALVGSDVASYGVATETGAAIALVGSVAAAYGVSTETDSAVALAGSVAAAYGVATETDSAVALTIPAAPSPARAYLTISAIVPGPSMTVSAIVPGPTLTVAAN